MKKVLLLFSWLCLLSAIGVIAQSKHDQRNSLYTLSANLSGLQVQKQKRVPALPVRHDSPEGYVYSIAVNPANPVDAYAFNYIKAGQRLYMGFGFEKEELKNFIGSRITHINVTSGTSNSGTNQVKDVTVFITKGLGQEPIITKKGTLKGSEYTVNSIKLDSPYEISDDTPLYIGYYFTYQNNSGFYIPVDGAVTNKPGNLYVFCDGTDWPGENKWENQAPEIGSLCMSVTLQGDALPQNVANMNSVSIPSTLKIGEELSYTIELINKGANAINSVEVETTVAGKSQKSTVNLSGLASGSLAQANVSGIRVDKSGIYDVTSTITKVNGVANTSSSNSGSGIVACYSEGYPRNMVLEEGTGTWCGYCPAGIVMFEYVREKYADRIFPIAVHQGDRMEISEYQKFIAEYISGFPTVVANRAESFSPSTYMADKLYREVVDNPSYANIQFTCSVDGKTLKIASETEFSLNTDIEHQLSFVVVEDGVGPYKQANYFGQGSGMGKWDTAGSEVSTLFDDVARHIDSYPGIPNSLPSTIEAGKKYAFNREISISRVKSNQFRVIALITNSRTGEIINSAMVSIAPEGDISLDKKSILLHPEETAQLTATIHGDNAGGKIITWSSSDKKVATVDNAGLVTAVGPGKAVITASCDGKSAECEVEVSIMDAIFEVDGIRYKVTGASTCEVTKPKEGEKYPQEHFIIPETVTYYNLAYTVTAIGEGAFSHEYCSNPKSVDLPNTIVELGGWAFNGWNALESIKIPTSVTIIGPCAFQACSSLTNIEIPSSVTAIMPSAFAFCSNLKEVKFFGTPVIGSNSFWNCPLEKITCESTTPPSLDSNAFGENTDVYETCTLYVPKESIDTYKTAPVWENFKDIKNNTITLNHPTLKLRPRESETLTLFFKGENIEGKNATWSSSDENIVTVDVNGRVTAVSGGKALITTTYGTISTECSVEVKYFVDDIIEVDGFRYRIDESSTCGIWQPENWDDYRNHTTITIPESIELDNIQYTVTSIGRWAFSNCIQLESIEIPKSVTRIEQHAIYGCPLEKITCKSTTPPSLEDNTVFYENTDLYETCTLYVPKESIDTYKTAPVWENFKNIKAIDSTDGIDEIIDEESTCDAFSLTGILVAQGKTVAELRNELPAGVYVLRFANGKTSKIIIR